MKRIAVVVLGAAWMVLLPAMALAQEGSGLGEPPGPEVAGTGGSIGGAGGVGGVSGGSAFTGAEVAGLIALAVALLVVGVAAVLLTRRRAASAHGS
jgi:hypothetical protein